MHLPFPIDLLCDPELALVEKIECLLDRLPRATPGLGRDRLARLEGFLDDCL
jgi:hypothetical protein